METYCLLVLFVILGVTSLTSGQSHGDTSSPVRCYRCHGDHFGNESFAQCLGMAPTTCSPGQGCRVMYTTDWHSLPTVGCSAVCSIFNQQALDGTPATRAGMPSMKDITIVMGDLNAKVGSDNTGFEEYMGKQGVGARNQNGERFLEFCIGNNLVIGGTIFKHKDIHKETWNPPDGKTRNQIDHAAINRRWRSSLVDVRAIRGGDIDDLDKYCSQVQDAFANTSEQILGYKITAKKPWIRDETWKLIEERKRLKQGLLSSQGEQRIAAITAYRAKNKLVKTAARNNKKTYLEDKASEAQEAAFRGDAHTLYRITRDLTRTNSSQPSTVKDEHGKLITKLEDQCNRWANQTDPT
ncbi:craniofacial development protein 2 [Elysia marginata]|uniref:Craniofacial development protein 2 n=1 Tax=Elysia marginata TaxID=1093978 RepID=A0AAV4HMC7_9GAST|nr:craniofacial development protein 2 [Elysia marginata]